MLSEKKSQSDSPIRLGIISALPHEQQGLNQSMQQQRQTQRGMRDYSEGNCWGIDCISVLSRIGKVAAAATAVVLIERFAVTHILFTGVAGSADQAVQIGDIVIAEQLIQHDMNAQPLFPRFQVPLTERSEFTANADLNQQLSAAVDDFIRLDFLNVIQPRDRQQFCLETPRLHQGLIASGDEFICSEKRIRTLKADLPSVLAVEMEGAAVAQVCFEYGLPFAVIRTISDKANAQACIDFLQFIEKVAAPYAFHTIRRFCLTMAQKRAMRLAATPK
ncbi:MAG: 5'-methylthioadenosine/adenosylhomocysteine nucleosidase [Pseudomonadota bacterium]